MGPDAATLYGHHSTIRTIWTSAYLSALSGDAARRSLLLVKVRAADTDSLTRILDLIGELESVGAVQTTIVLETFLEKHGHMIPEQP